MDQTQKIASVIEDIREAVTDYQVIYSMHYVKCKINVVCLRHLCNRPYITGIAN